MCARGRQVLSAKRGRSLIDDGMGSIGIDRNVRVGRIGRWTWND